MIGEMAGLQLYQIHIRFIIKVVRDKEVFYYVKCRKGKGIFG